MPRTLEDYRKLPYQRALEAHEEAGQRYFVYRLVEIPQVVGDGESKDEAQENLRRCFDDFVEWRLESGLPIPEPTREVSQASSQKRLVDAPLCVSVAAQPSSRLPVDETRSLADALSRILVPEQDDLLLCH